MSSRCQAQDGRIPGHVRMHPMPENHSSNHVKRGIKLILEIFFLVEKINAHEHDPFSKVSGKDFQK
ncbi:hypothetical protein [Nitrosopumilus sp.]|uniref:hypothetical protein n=1 Tax=Nitrosopumilus sp. TaxID=2024843 RepID=UPI00292D059B|nr:hypothetical protein [Nitrosopumilus sp.]